MLLRLSSEVTHETSLKTELSSTKLFKDEKLSWIYLVSIEHFCIQLKVGPPHLMSIALGSRILLCILHPHQNGNETDFS